MTTQPESFVTVPNSLRTLRHGARRVRDLDSHARVELTLTLAGPKLPELDASSKTLTPQQFAAAYAVPPDTVATVAAALRHFGLSVDAVAQAGRSIHASGTAAAVEAMFHAHLGVYHHAEQGEYRGREGTVQMPKELSGLVTGVLGLDQRQVAHRKVAATKPTAALAPLGPTDLEKRYQFPTTTGAGQTVAIAEFGTPTQTGGIMPPGYFPEDVQAFCAKYQRDVPTINVVPVNVTPLTLAQVQKLPSDQQQDTFDVTTEVMMDVEIVASLCPKATVNVYFASFDQKGWVDLIDAVTSGAKGIPVSLSVSWGLAEDDPDWAGAAVDAINERLQIAAMHGITVCVSSGDDGSGDEMTDKAAHVDFPASSPFVLGVGGTQLVTSGGAIVEESWYEAPGRRTGKGGGASGGGVSVKFPRPSWQTVHIASINHASIDGRVVPDVSALSGAPFYDLIYVGQDSPNGGTSASAPLWASMIARVNQALAAAKQQRFLAPLLYAKSLGATACTDIATGHDNASHPSPGKGFAPGAGFDVPTGWGVPNGLALVEQL